MQRVKSTTFAALAWLLAASAAIAAEPDGFGTLRTEYQQDVRRLLKTYCLDCHDAATKDGEFDLERYGRFEDVRRDAAPWAKVDGMLAHGEMPPEDSQQPSADEMKLLRGWVQRYLDAEARASAGDPGPVVLRRLSNAQYTYTVRDLTGIPLDPARQFPVDGAAGEGFTNTGNALVMSPALFGKYLDAAKGIAEHAVLLPDAIRFSPGITRRDWTNEILAEIRDIYRRNTSGYDEGHRLDHWSVANPLKVSEADGRVDLARYFSALIRHRDRLLADPSTIGAIAQEEHLNAKYARLIAEMLVSSEPESMLLGQLRSAWRNATPEDASILVDQVHAWQDRLWKFNSVGHYGSIRPWQQAESPLPESVALREKIETDDAGEAITIWLATSTEGSASVVWQRPRIEFKDRPAILLRDVRRLSAQIESRIRNELARTERYLAGLGELHNSKKKLDDVAAEGSLDASLLRRWADYLDLGRRIDLSITGYATAKMTQVDGKRDVNGWGVPATPCFLANSSDEPISVTTLTIPPHGVTAHPSPQEQACIAWRSPIDGKIRLTGKIADADDKCGNGAKWSVEVRGNQGERILQEGAIDNGRDAVLSGEDEIDVHRSELIVVRIDARDRNHVCDTTSVELTISEAVENGRQWDLSRDVSGDILAGNPHADMLGNAEVWHFFTAPINQSVQDKTTPVVAESALARWRVAIAGNAASEDLNRRAQQVQMAVMSPRDSVSDADKQMVDILRDWNGPLAWSAETNLGMIDKPTHSTFGIDEKRFGKRPDGKLLDRDSLLVPDTGALEIRIPAALVRGGEFVVDASLDESSSGGSMAQVQLLSQKPPQPWKVAAGTLILTKPGSPARAKLAKAYDDFRELFPDAMCYARIVPVDEVVTLVLFHREDEHLARLMLDDTDAQRLDYLWDELHYVSQDAFTSLTAHEQLIAFATQDRQDLIKPFQDLKPGIEAKAAALRERLLETEPAHIEAVLKFAEKAYRRPLKPTESDGLRNLYAILREENLPHNEAIRLLLARVLSSPAFLYRLEQPGPGQKAVDVTDRELASRLSYFLWSSVPDEKLNELASQGRLHDDGVLSDQTKRMLRDKRTRRLAIQFACQWLQVRNFDQLDEKSERHFPQFVDLRGDMYEETIQFFTDLVQNDGSVLDLLDADHTFLNENLARYYGINDVQGDQWRKVEGVKRFGRGGILKQAAILAKQSGASRTSPILRGNWISETILGDRLPRPPKGVPVLPEDVPEGLTERQLIERHTSDEACAKCHSRFDPYGFALEEYDAIGRFRQKDVENHPIDANAVLPDGTRLDGADGLRDYLLSKRRDDFLRQFCRKLLGYALGRSVQISDQPLLDKMLSELAANDYHFSAAVETIVLSKQFRQIRGVKYTGAASPPVNDQ